MAAFGVLLYLASPAIADIAARSGKTFSFTRCCSWRFWPCCARCARCGGPIALVGASALVLAAQHLALPDHDRGACTLLCRGLVRTGGDSRGRSRTCAQGAAGVSGSGLIYYVVAHATHVKPSLVSSYSDHVYSLFQNDSLARYLRAFLMFAQGYVASGDLAVTQWTTRC